ncbi:MAG: ABC transporter permease [Acidobacteria bacterium]|nr:ABC transporter permease [Acidobacteriota bacterium]
MRRWLDSLLGDLRHGARNLRKAPGLVVVSVVSLGLAIGLNLTLYAGVSTIFGHQPTMTDAASVVGIEPGNGRQWSVENYRDLRDNGIFAGVVGFRLSSMNRRAGDRLDRIGVMVVTDNFFEGLGIQTRLGRAFTTADAVPERAPRLVVLDHSYWQARFNGDPAIVGQTMTLDGEAFTVIGVLPESYRSVVGFASPGAYVPVSALTLPTLADRGSQALSVLARLEPGMTAQQAQARVTALAADLERRFPDLNEGLSRPAAVFAAREMQFRGSPVGFRLLPIVLLGLFSLVLLIGAVNVAGLLLARSVGRQQELTIRSALGASRARVVQALLAESFLLSLLSAAAGVGLAALLPRVEAIAQFGPRAGTFDLDARMLLPGLLLVLITTLLCGIAPAVRASRIDVMAGLRRAGGGTSADSTLRGGFVVAQVAVSLVLLVVAALCLRSQMRIVDIDLGFDLDHGVVARFSVDPAPGLPDAREAYIDRLTSRLQQIPGVETVTISGVVPLGGDALVASFHPAGRSDVPATRPTTLSVGPAYFDTLDIPLVAGREFAAADRAGAPAVAIVNQTFASTYFAGRLALGERIDIGGETEAEIVGVVRDSKIDTLGEAPKSVVFYPFAQRPRRPTAIARTTGDPARVVTAVRAAVMELDASASVNVSTLRDAASLELSMRRTGTEMMGGIGALGLFLTTIGLYGVVSYLVASRTREMGIRLALGATSSRLHNEVRRRALRLVATGIAIGTVLSLLVSPLLSTFLAGLSPADPIAFAGAAALLMLVALIASDIPARRVARVDPVTALRE